MDNWLWSLFKIFKHVDAPESHRSLLVVYATSYKLLGLLWKKGRQFWMEKHYYLKARIYNLKLHLYYHYIYLWGMVLYIYLFVTIHHIAKQITHAISIYMLCWTNQNDHHSYTLTIFSFVCLGLSLALSHFLVTFAFIFHSLVWMCSLGLFQSATWR